MLESIVLKNIATYDPNGVVLTDLKKINFIYGSNGSGKTTISNFVANPSDTKYSACAKNWKNGVRLKVLCYNKEFRERNFGKSSIDGVFTLGQATKEEIEAINAMQSELEGLKDTGLTKRTTIEKLEAEKQNLADVFKDRAWNDVFKKFDSDFSEAFSGLRNSKEQFKKRLLDEFKKNSAELISREELKSEASTVLNGTPTALQPLPTIDTSRIVEIEQDPIWHKRILGKADVGIAALVQRLNLNDWLNEGRRYLQDDQTCPFCQQQTITDDFRRQLEDYFDETFTNDANRVKALSEEYDRLTSDLVNLLEGIETTEKGSPSTKLDVAAFSASLKTLESQFVANKEIVRTKASELSRDVELVSSAEQGGVLVALIESANALISKHNELVSNYTAERTRLINQIWRHVTEDYRSQIEEFNKELNGRQTGIEKLTAEKDEIGKQYKELKDKIRIANKNVTSVQPSVDEINRMLRSFGFTNFSIVPSDLDPNQYQIKRQDGTVAAETLSEGEITFITFLYFFQLCRGSTSQESITDERVIFIDDPISSLDSNILFVVSSLVKEIIRSIKAGEGSIKQLVLLTHNVYFHKEASFIDGRTSKDKDRNYWILRRNGNLSQVEAFGMENPIRNSYELLWHELRNPNANSKIAVQNAMRRIIEHYFKILGKYGDDALIEKFDNAQEQQICRSLISWINEGSHTIPDDLFIESHGDTTEKYLDVFQQIFKKMGHEEHYNMMMNGVS